ncbi:MAG: glycosyltransferase [Firmicutes bacterium]|nr:glycosyltransferase [Bacillota bacterium]
MSNIIGKNIQLLRKHLSLSQSDLATKLCISVQAVSKWETGKANPDIYLLPQIAECLKVPVETLFEAQGAPDAARSFWNLPAVEHCIRQLEYLGYRTEKQTAETEKEKRYTLTFSLPRKEQFPLISVLIPVYQVEPYLRACLDSVFAQSYPNLEILLVDDGSTDASPVICQEYIDRGTIPVRYWRYPHQGVSAARQKLVQEARGDLFFFLDADDYIYPNAIFHLYRLMKENHAGAAQCRMERVEEVDYPPLDMDSERISVYQGELLLDQFSCGTSPDGCEDLLRCMLAAKLYRKELLQHVQFPIGKIHEDEALMHRILGECTAVVCTSLPLYRYYQNPDSLMKKTFSHARYDALDAIADRIQYTEQMGHPFAAQMNRLRLCFECIRMIRETKANIGENDPWIPKLRIRYEEALSDLLPEPLLPEALTELLQSWKNDPFRGEKPSYWETARKLYHKKFRSHAD